MTDAAIAPVLSTPDTHVFQETAVEVVADALPRLSDERLYLTYEIQRTVAEIRDGRWKRIALQFPDHMLPDAPRVFTALSHGLNQLRKSPTYISQSSPRKNKGASEVDTLSQRVNDIQLCNNVVSEPEEELYILADTSYGACCVDEIAAEHADADVIVHYGRSCLSPTTRLPVIYIFTKPSLDTLAVVRSFKDTYVSKDEKIILMADIPYAAYLPEIAEHLRNDGYLNLFETVVVHNTRSPLPNRTVPEDVSRDVENLHKYSIFHISDPPSSLLLTLASSVSSMNIYPTISGGAATTSAASVSSLSMLRRRYALLTSIATVPVFGILINTLSVKNYMHVLAHIKKIIAAAGKKSYTFVVGKVNAAKVANFAEVGGWVVIGCWESSLFDSREFWKPVITPFELELALQGDEERLWTGRWTSDFEVVLKEAEERERSQAARAAQGQSIENVSVVRTDDQSEGDELDSEDESVPPEFDLHTGRYVSQSRPMKRPIATQRTLKRATLASTSNSGASQSLIKPTNGDLAVVGSEISPAAQFFREKRSWKGLGSDYEIAYDDEIAQDNHHSNTGAPMEQGRIGIARGYIVGESTGRH